MSDVVIRVKTQGTQQSRQELQRVIPQSEFDAAARWWDEKYGKAVKSAGEASKRAGADSAKAMDDVGHAANRTSISVYQMRSKILETLGPGGAVALGGALAVLMLERVARMAIQAAEGFAKMGREAERLKFLGQVLGPAGAAGMAGIGSASQGTIGAGSAASLLWQAGGAGVSGATVTELSGYARALGLLNGQSPSAITGKLLGDLRNPTSLSGVLGEHITEHQVESMAEQMFGKVLSSMTETEKESANLAISLRLIRDRMHEIGQPANNVADGFDRMGQTLKAMKDDLGGFIGFLYHVADMAHTYAQQDRANGISYGGVTGAELAAFGKGSSASNPFSLGAVYAARPRARPAPAGPELPADLEKRASAALALYRAQVAGGGAGNGAGLRRLAAQLGARGHSIEGTDPQEAARLLAMQKEMADALREPMQRALQDNRALLSLYEAQAKAGQFNVATARQLAAIYRAMRAQASTGRPQDRAAALGLATDTRAALAAEGNTPFLYGYNVDPYRANLAGGMDFSSYYHNGGGASGRDQFTDTGSFGDLVRRVQLRSGTQRLGYEKSAKDQSQRDQLASRYADQFSMALVTAAASAHTFSEAVSGVARTLLAQGAGDLAKAGASSLAGLFGKSAGTAAGAAAAGGSALLTGGLSILGAVGVSLLAGAFSSQQSEEAMYRAHLRALRDDRQDQPIFQLVFPAGSFYDTRNPDFQEAIAGAMEQMAGKRVGRVLLTFAN